MPPIRTGSRWPDPRTPSAPCLEPAVLISALSQLERELTQPLERLRGNLIYKLAESPGLALSALGGTCRPETLVNLCDELIDMTRVFFDDSAVRKQALAPGSEPSLRLSTLLDEVDRRFAPEAAQNELDWQCRFDGPDATLAADPLWSRQATGRILSDVLANACSGTAVCLWAHLDGTMAVIRITIDGQARSPVYRLESEEPEHCALGFARSLLNHLGGGLEATSSAEDSFELVLRLPVQL